MGIGPGLGTEESELLHHIFQHFKKPVVLDADALNTIALQNIDLNTIPKDSVLTPHPKEFERLFGNAANDFERINKALEMSNRYPLVIVLKGHRTLIAYKGKGYFNTTGNAGMATGGSGDVLTGIITSFMAQGYNSLQAAILGVYIHGLAADLALLNESKESLLPNDIIDFLGKAFKKIVKLDVSLIE
jgi:NAD(P)H-hydrate epimerase